MAWNAAAEQLLGYSVSEVLGKPCYEILRGVTDFLPTLNGGGGFAGHTDWRLPNVKELQSIVDYSREFPSIHPDFGPTASYYTWSATSHKSSVFQGNAWTVVFAGGDVNVDGKWNVFNHVRAVRNGSCP